ncbi:hypothetical protein BRC64_09470 [Halobacteriales archaeon QH_10_67_22]|nr:MAG: hypothetical protein BRC64_09470 [Halobacteriales archaeon QH_10_67_22]
MDRRTFLREGMVATAGVGVLATAGCSQVPVVGSGGSGRPYARWLHAPGELTNTEYYGALVVDAATVFDNLDRFEREYAVNVESAYRPTLESAGVAPAAVDKLVETTRRATPGGW